MKRKNEGSGFVLVILLVIISVLVVFVLEYHYSVKIDVDIIEGYKNSIKALFAAKAGLHLAIALLENDEDLENNNLEEEWAKKIIQLINHQKESTTMGQNGYLVLKENYNKELFYNNIIKMYNSVLQKH